jgi:hypothetical protein
MSITVLQTFVIPHPKGMIVGNAGDTISDPATLERLESSLGDLIDAGKAAPVAVPAKMAAKPPAPAPAPVAQPVAADAAPVAASELSELSRAALMAVAKGEGVVIDRNANKATLIAAITAHRAPPVGEPAPDEEAPAE